MSQSQDETQVQLHSPWSRTWVWILSIVAATSALAFSSCSENGSTTPESDSTGNSSPLDKAPVIVAPPETPDDIRNPAPAPPEKERYTPDVESQGEMDVGTTSKTINGSEGGSVSRGIFQLDIPEDAVDGDVQFQIDIPDDGSIRVQLLPHGLQFDRPVLLTMDLSDAVGLGDEASLFWWNEAKENWDNVGGHFDPKTRILTAKLTHFSTYAPGRAGWSSGSGKSADGTDKGGDNKGKK